MGVRMLKVPKIGNKKQIRYNEKIGESYMKIFSFTNSALHPNEQNSRDLDIYRKLSNDISPILKIKK